MKLIKINPTMKYHHNLQQIFVFSDISNIIVCGEKNNIGGVYKNKLIIYKRKL